MNSIIVDHAHGDVIESAAMPTLKPLRPSDFERVTKFLGRFMLRLGATVAAIERESRRQVVNGATANRRRRRHSPIDRAAVLKIVRSAGKKGFAAGRIAERLRVDVSRIRPVLWQMRDAGQLRMTGKLALARYHLPDSSARNRSGTRTKRNARTPNGTKPTTARRGAIAKPSRRSGRAA